MSSAWTPSYPISPTRSGFISAPKLNRKRDGRNDEFPTNQDIGISRPTALKFKADADACADLFNAKLANCRGGRVAPQSKDGVWQDALQFEEDSHTVAADTAASTTRLRQGGSLSAEDWRAARRLTSEATNAKSDG
jgi:hypothetical protein